MHQILFKYGFFEIRTYGVMVAAAFMISILAASYFAKKEGIKTDIISDIGLIAIAGGIIGARALYVLVGWKSFFSTHIPDIFMVWEGGLVFYGGLIGAFTGVFIYVLAKKEPFFGIADLLIPFVALGHSIGRLGCFFNGCCYGRADNVHGMIFPSIGGGVPRLPTQLYESGLNLMNFILLLFLYDKLKQKKGILFFLYVFNYGIIRVIMETFRGDDERGMLFGFSTSTVISYFMIAAGLAGLIFLWFKYERKLG